MLDDRKAQILRALVESYIKTGEPVSSAAILDSSGLNVSSATVRSELARLEAYGFVVQPHASAGRIPTEQGYRYYVDHCTPTRLRAATRARIESFFRGFHHELTMLLKDTSNLLSDISHYPAVILGPGLVDETVRGIHLVQLSGRVVLVVVVAESGRVSQELVKVAAEVGDDDLDTAERLLAGTFVGRSIKDGIADIGDVPDDEVGAGVAALLRSASRSLERAEQGTRDVYLGGTSHLASLWEDLANVHRVLGLLEREAAVLEILDEQGEGTTVRIGGELNLEGVDLAVVSTRYEAGEYGSGRVGVLGPMRMNYRRTIKIVEEVSEGLEDSLGG
jgi:heat-inducible transcriptional repressor